MAMDASAAAAGGGGEMSRKETTATATAPPPELDMVACAVQRLVARNDAVAALSGGGEEGAGVGMAAFEAAKGAPAPRIGVAQYLERVHRYAVLEPECYVVAYAYVDMVAHRRPAAAVDSRNVHRLLLACLLVASKVHDDFHHNNAFFARVGGVSNAEMNKLELELLAVLDFEVMLSHRVYELYRAHLEKEAQRDGGGGVLAGAGAATAGAGRLMAAVAPSKLPERAVVNGAGDPGPPDGAAPHDWRSLGTEAAAANGVRLHTSSPSRYSFDC
ncbi:cyclin-P1-1 [Oryza brachyantha]|uniref:cyclin-P1-1 n=1 Tax=Oryza brachyantha TaxID=4533 RepID=UPI001AD95C74|nr:cyclin-P1-1 [Oryza brachyantha]